MMTTVAVRRHGQESCAGPVRLALLGLALLLAVILPPSPAACAEPDAARVLVSPKTAPAPVTIQHLRLRLEPDGETPPGWLRSGTTWACPPGAAPILSSLSLHLLPEQAGPVRLFAHQSLEFSTLDVLFRGTPDNPPTATLTLAVQTPKGLRRFAYSMEDRLTALAELPLDRGTFQAKDKLYLVRRELGLAPDQTWRYTHENGFTIIQRRVDEPVAAQGISSIALGFAPDFDARKASLNLRFSKGGRRPSETAFLDMHPDRNSPGAFLVELPQAFLAKGSAFHLAEVIVFIPGVHDPTQPGFPLHRITLGSVSRAGLDMAYDPTGAGRISLRLDAVPDLLPGFLLQDASLMVRPSRADRPFAFQPNASWLGQVIERPASLLTTRDRAIPFHPPWEPPTTWFEASRFTVPTDYPMMDTGLRVDKGILHVNGTYSELEIPFQSRRFATSSAMALQLDATGDADALASAEATWLLGQKAARALLSPGRLVPLPPGMTPPLDVKLNLGFLRRCNGLAIGPLRLYVRDPADPAAMLMPTGEAQPLRIGLPPGMNQPHAVDKDSATFMLPTDVADDSQTLLLSAPGPLPRHGILTFRYALPMHYAAAHPEGLRIEARGATRSNKLALPLATDTGTATLPLDQITGPDWPENEPIQSLALSFAPQRTSLEGIGVGLYSFREFTVAQTELKPWVDVLPGAPLAKLGESSLGLPGLTPGNAAALLRGEAWLDLPLPPEALAADLEFADSPWLATRALVLPWTPTPAEPGDESEAMQAGRGYMVWLRYVLALAGVFLLVRFRKPLASLAVRTGQWASRSDAALQERYGRAACLPWLGAWAAFFAAGALANPKGPFSEPLQSAAALAAVLAWRGLESLLRPILARRASALAAFLGECPWSWPLTGALLFLGLTLGAKLVNLPALPGHLSAACFLCLAWAVAGRIADTAS